MRNRIRWILPVLVVAAAAATAAATSSANPHGDASTATPIKHLVVIFQENVSFDHYFGTYPDATNPPGEPAFHAAPDTPSVNGLQGALLTENPNSSNPQRLDRSQALTCDQNHGYTAEQKAFDMGAMDKFIPYTDVESCSPPDTTAPGLVMDYYDGNTVTGLWNYAQNFAMSDNSYSDTFGPSTPGALNVTVSNTYGAICGPSSAVINAAPCTASPGATPPTPQAPTGTGTVYSDADPNYDICSSTQDGRTAAATIQMSGKNIGDLLDSENITWGWFQGGFASPNYVSGKPSTDDLSAVCTASHTNVGGAVQKDYNPHHEPFQYFASTANPTHVPPTSIAKIGEQDQANHQYDLRDFWAAADNGNMPAVSYLKAADYQDGHAGYSDPLDEQTWLVDTINRLEKLPTWNSTAVVILYDDSDGWYDHQMGPVLMQSQTPLDALTGTGQCGSNPAKVPTGDGAVPEQGRCGPGQRQPLLVISPYSKHNFVDGTLTTQASVVRFIEDNWLGDERIGNGSEDAFAGTLNNMFSFDHPQGPTKLFLDPSTGEPDSGH
ncbi:MAG TPA: alkaline phosphatase family protein [Gaiellaceae bacterium]|jgi:phospholipase C